MASESGPDRINRYEIQGLIARGGMGRVYLARDPNTSRLVVVKLLDATLDSSEVRDRFDREGKSLASLSHPNIVHIYDYGDFQESPFIVMEYVRGETLEEKIKRRAPLSVSDKLRLMSELCAGLAHAHASGIIHRDVKPANLMVDQDERLKILDFGIARVLDSNLTRGNTLAGWTKLQIGTPGYMSPEQTRGDEIDHRTDIFSVGAVCYELLAYREAFPGANPREVETKVMRTPPAPLAGQVPDIDPQIDSIIARALALDRKDRFPDAAALHQAFEQIRLRVGPSTMSSTRPTVPAIVSGGQAASRADVAFGRAVAAYDEKAFDVAKRLALEALAEAPRHAGARTLLARLEPARPAPLPPPAPAPLPAPAPRRADMDRPRRNPEPISIDPTVLIERADRPGTPEPIEPTIAISREDVARARGGSDAPRNPPPPRRQPAPVSEPTVLVQSPRQPASGSRKAGPPPALPFWLRVKALFGPAGPGSAPRPRQSAKAPAARGRGDGAWTPTTRGAMLVVAAVAVAAMFLFGVVQFWQWLTPSEQQLTVERPVVGGTIVGGGIDCGSRGSTCTASVRTGEGIELRADPDPGYVLGKFTGDCPATGRLLMTQAKTCGATFERVGTPTADGTSPAGTQWPLTITKPTGGSVVFEDILCGTLDDRCTAQISDGRPVALVVQTDPKHRFIGFTGDCAPNGETTMSGARTCGATFARAETTETPIDLRPEPVNRPPKPSGSSSASTKPAAVPPPPTATDPVGKPPASTQSAAPSSSQATPQPTAPAPPVVDAATKAAPPETADDHAKKEITRLVNSYCAALQSMDPAKVRTYFPLADQRTLRDQFRQYKSLKCAVTEPKFLVLQASGADGAGSAQVKFEMKQTLVSKSGGAPEVHETVVTLRTSRKTNLNLWLIDGVEHEAKPK